MSGFDITAVKEKCENGIKTMSGYVDTAKDISVHPKFSASLSVSSKRKGESYFNKGVKVDKELSLFKIIGIVLAVLAAFVAASIIVNSVFDALTGKKKCRKSRCTDDGTLFDED